jgi:predicted dehydrogenase
VQLTAFFNQGFSTYLLCEEPFMPAKTKVGFAVVGLGKIARGSVLPAFRNCRNAKLLAIVGRDPHKTVPLARTFRAASHYHSDNYAGCLANPDVAAIYIATPPSEHLQLTIQAAQAGKHVLCEKPLAANIEQSAAMVEACRRSRVLLMTAYRKFYEPSALALKQLIRSGKLGRIDVIHTAFSELYVPGVSPSWLVDSKVAGGGPLMDLGVYCVNTTRWLVGQDPTSVTAQSWVNNTDKFQGVEEGISFRLQFPSGLLVHGSTSYGAVLSSFIFVQGTKGWASLSPAFPFDEERLLLGKIQKRSFERKFKIIDEFALEIDAFASAIQNKRTIEADGAQGHRDMVIINAIYESAKTNQFVSIQH